jgi:hypothetical protein
MQNTSHGQRWSPRTHRAKKCTARRQRQNFHVSIQSDVAPDAPNSGHQRHGSLLTPLALFFMRALTGRQHGLLLRKGQLKYIYLPSIKGRMHMPEY